MNCSKFIAVASIISASCLFACGDDTEGKPALPDTVVTCADLNCTSDQYCGKDMKDVLSCLPKGKKNDPCTEDKHCQGDLKCIDRLCDEEVVEVTCESLNCTSEQYCGEGSEGTLACLDKGVQGDACSETAPCNDEFQCLEGVCSLIPIIPEVTCESLNCTSEQYCGEGSEGTLACLDKGVQGDACSETAPCKDNLLCEESVCIEIPPPASGVRIHELFAGGVTNAEGAFKSKYVVLHNNGDVAVDLSQWSLQKLSHSGNGSTTSCKLTGAIQPRGYLLVEIIHMASGKGLRDLPNVDITCSANLTVTSGNGLLVLYSSQDVVTATSDMAGVKNAHYVDGIAWGSSLYYEGSSALGSLGQTNVYRRKTPICQEAYDTDDNVTDFELVDISAPDYTPANSTTPTVSCEV